MAVDIVNVPTTKSISFNQINKFAKLTADTHYTIYTVNIEQITEIAARIAERFRYISENNENIIELLNVYSF